VNNEAFEEIAAGIAHEIKNPVALALANLEIMKAEDGENRPERYAALEKQLHKINDLVQFFFDSTLDETKEVFLLDMFDELVSAYEFSNTKRIRFELRVPEAEAVLAGPKQLELVFSNILKNAVEACGEGGVISISAERRGSYVTVAVTDNGCGIAEDAARKALAGGYTTKPDGSGKGLSLCRMILARLGGELRMASSETGGCRVSVSLTCANTPDSQPYAP
jgi:signal transduction histidine kinase